MRRFFDRRVDELVAEIADASALTVFVGAGASVEAGLPAWNELVSTLLDEAIAARGWTSLRSELHDAAAKRGPLETAEIVEALLERRLARRIKEALYRGASPRSFHPGPLASAIAAVQAAFGKDARILTTNYDLLIEEALRSVPNPPWTSVRDEIDASGPPKEE